MSYSKHVNEYRKTAVNSASPLQLVVMLYDGALRFTALGRDAMVRQDTFAQNGHLQKAQKIVAELMACLDLAKGGEIARNLFALYTFCYNSLVQGNMEDDPNALDQSSKVLEELRESWILLESQHRTSTNLEAETDEFRLAA